VARVAWTRRALTPGSSRNLEAPGYGVEFVDGSSHELACLDEYLKRLDRTVPSPTTPTTAPTALARPLPSPRP
jgi:hypothetical protein